MPICLDCGAHSQTVYVLWNPATRKDERFCQICAFKFRQAHIGQDVTPKGSEEERRHIQSQFITQRCEVCGKDTVNKKVNAEGVLLCFGCIEEFERLGYAQSGGRKFVGGTNGITIVKPPAPAMPPPAIVKTHWCYKHLGMVPEEQGRRIPNTHYDWWCFDCIEKEAGDVQNWHIRLKITGKPEAIEFFHWMMRRLDNDWEGGGEFATPDTCPHCKGWEWANPRMKPEQVKKLGKMAGLRKVKVVFWGKASSCEEKSIAKQFAHNMLEGMVH